MIEITKMENQNNKYIQVIQHLMESFVDAINYDDLSKRIVIKLSQLFQAELCTLWRLVQTKEGNKLILSASIGLERHPGEEIPTYRVNVNADTSNQIDGVTGWIAARKKICKANSFYDLAENPNQPWYGCHRGKWDQLTFMRGDVKRHFRSLLGLPLCFGESRNLIGIIKIENTKKKEGFTENDLALAKQLLPFVSIALQSMTKREQHEKQRQLVLKNLTAALPILDVTAFHQQVVNNTAKLLNADICSLWLVSVHPEMGKFRSIEK